MCLILLGGHRHPGQGWPWDGPAFFGVIELADSVFLHGALPPFGRHPRARFTTSHELKWRYWGAFRAQLPRRERADWRPPGRDEQWLASLVGSKGAGRGGGPVRW